MTYFLDTSAIAKIYFDETGSDAVRQLVNSEKVIFISSLTSVEMAAAFEKAKRLRFINSPIYREITKRFERDLWKEPFRSVAITTGQIIQARLLVRKRQLRAPDAIQLASALETAKRVEGRYEFLSFDHALADAARLEGLKCPSL